MGGVVNFKLLAVIAALSLLVVFVAQNYEVVEIKFLFWTVKASRAIVLFLTLITGLIVGWTLTNLTRLKK
jgi:uncharacterized integral membrane protein